MKQRGFAKYAWGVLGYNILVILWGAYVRATGSGAGCGRHWPLCNGEVVPRAPEIETIIEYVHRTSSAFAGVLVIILLVWAFRAYGKGHAVRKAAVFSLIFIITEGLVGAGLVLLEWVGDDDSVGRAVTMALHLSNTFLLLGALGLTAWWATTMDDDDYRAPLQLRGQGRRAWLLGVGLLLIMVVSAAGAVTALGDTLFPSETLAEGVARDFSPTAHFLERLRVWHPLLAVLTALYLFTTLGLVQAQRGDERTRRLVRLVQLLLVAQLAAGAINLILLAPVFMQLLHLLLADAVWLALVFLSASALETSPEPVAERQMQLSGAG
ncbi:MAG TPA: COX15/CtaA family protein [Candidatus Sulfomarinibacteraceae bacterium]|nr:COX15/CtaA family protein [Candidatus Sulfomarinibacteraceae bacterium]